MTFDHIPARFRILADALCMRLDSVDGQLVGARPQEGMRLGARREGIADALALCLKAAVAPKPPVVDCAINVANNPATADAMLYYLQWCKEGRYKMGEHR